MALKGKYELPEAQNAVALIMFFYGWVTQPFYSSVIAGVNWWERMCGGIPYGGVLRPPIGESIIQSLPIPKKALFYKGLNGV